MRKPLITLMSALILCAPPTLRAQEGIKVHGDWTITVRDPDGSVAARYEFKNALSVNASADEFLARLLARQVTTGGWTVNLFTSDGMCPFGPVCAITESAVSGFADSKDLTLAVPQSGPHAKKFVLKGSVRGLNAGNILGVGTHVRTCGNTTAAASCVSNSGAYFFTSKDLAAPIAIVNDQTVDVLVVISFS